MTQKYWCISPNSNVLTNNCSVVLCSFPRGGIPVEVKLSWKIVRWAQNQSKGSESYIWYIFHIQRAVTIGANRPPPPWKSSPTWTVRDSPTCLQLSNFRYFYAFITIHFPLCTGFSLSRQILSRRLQKSSSSCKSQPWKQSVSEVCLHVSYLLRAELCSP